MKLYGSIGSPYVARVVMCARAKGLDLEPEMPEGGLKSAQYLSMNPLGKMPVLDVDGVGISESEVICEYLEDAFPERTLRPANPLDRARARLISRTFDLYVMSQTSALFRQLNPAARNQADVDAAFKDQKQWTRTTILNVANVGRFSVDRLVQQYASAVWNAKPISEGSNA